MVDHTAPLKEIKSVDKQHKPYYNKYIRDQWKIVKTRERTWLKYREQHKWLANKKERNIYNRLINYHKEAMYYLSSTRKQQKHKRPLQAY